ncbi:hypothetical protein Tco_1194494 [Tanacetum coccineum]
MISGVTNPRRIFSCRVLRGLHQTHWGFTPGGWLDLMAWNGIALDARWTTICGRSPFRPPPIPPTHQGLHTLARGATVHPNPTQEFLSPRAVLFPGSLNYTTVRDEVGCFPRLEGGAATDALLAHTPHWGHEGGDDWNKVLGHPGGRMMGWREGGGGSTPQAPEPDPLQGAEAAPEALKLIKRLQT